jgi:hypothetical protein
MVPMLAGAMVHPMILMALHLVAVVIHHVVAIVIHHLMVTVIHHVVAVVIHHLMVIVIHLSAIMAAMRHAHIGHAEQGAGAARRYGRFHAGGRCERCARIAGAVDRFRKDSQRISACR